MSFQEDLRNVLASPSAMEKIKVSDEFKLNDKFIVADLHFNNIIYVYNFLIILKNLSEIEQTRIIVNVPFNSLKEFRKLLRLCGHIVISPDVNFILKNSFSSIWKSLRFIIKFWRSDKIIDHGVNSLLYDSLLIAKEKPTISGVHLLMALDRLFLEYIYLIFYRSLEFNISLLIVGDTNYRYGVLLDTLTSQSERIIAPVNVNDFKLYSNFKETGTKIPFFKEINSTIDLVRGYYSKRKSNSIVHHDVNNAFKGGEGVLSGKPLVVISAHIFSDAPHNTELVGFRDYHDWFTQTCEFLSNLNPDEYDIYIRPHPSARLYGEDGLVESLAKKYNLRVIGNEVSSAWILEKATVIFTCGGTIAVEFAMEGKKAIASALTRFPDWDITLNAFTACDFDVQFQKSLSENILYDEKVSRRAAMLGYYYFELFDSDFEIEDSFLQLYYHKDYKYNSSDLEKAIDKISNTNALKNYIYQSIYNNS